MKSRLIAPVLVFTHLIAFLDQTVDKGWEKTVTLPSGS